MRGKVEKAKNRITVVFPCNFHVEKTLISGRFRHFHISTRLYNRRWMEMRGNLSWQDERDEMGFAIASINPENGQAGRRSIPWGGSGLYAGG